jgi:hypothetical protein
MNNSNQGFLKSITEAALFHPKWIHEPYSWVGHIPFASWLVRVGKPRIIVELGTHSGNSYFAICQAVNQYETGSKCYAVDTWQGDAHALSYGEDIHEMVRKHNEQNYASFSTLHRMTFDEALSKFEDGSVDLLHIDGLHTYDAVKHDFETWFPKLAPGAIVLFHDTNVRKEDFGVWKFWAEIKSTYPSSIEFKHSHGLGVLQLCNHKSDQSVTTCSFKPVLDSGEIEYFSRVAKQHELLGVEAANQKHLAQVRELWSERDQLAIKCQDLQVRIENMKSSISWKIGAPLRLIDKIIRRS